MIFHAASASRCCAVFFVVCAGQGQLLDMLRVPACLDAAPVKPGSSCALTMKCCRVCKLRRALYEREWRTKLKAVVEKLEWSPKAVIFFHISPTGSPRSLEVQMALLTLLTTSPPPSVTSLLKPLRHRTTKRSQHCSLKFMPKYYICSCF
jgi:hypothetical protein